MRIQQRWGFYFLLTILLTFFISSILTTTDVSALQIDAKCTDVEILFARGSGQDLKDSESKRFRKQLEVRIPEDKISRTFYELGTESYGGHQYPAVNVGDWRNGNAAGAWLSAGYANDYGKSVDAGVGELYTYLTERHKKCAASGTQYILGGYSQGAQVVGQTLPKLSSDVRSRIVFSALFGDPKLSLPEGAGKNPPACQGKDFSPWRRIIGGCKTNQGSLKARTPYIPTDVNDKTGLWCYAADFICGTSDSLDVNAGHSLYGKERHAIDIAVNEIVVKLATTLPNEQATHVIQTYSTGQHPADLDIAFILDTTGSMSSQIEQSKAFIRASAEKIKQLNGRIALTLYKDIGDEYTAKVVSGLSGDTTQLLAELDKVDAWGGGDEPEAALHALTTTFNTLDWKNGATKATILLTDASYHEPDLVDGSTLASVTKRSLEIDPVNIYPVVPAHLADYYQPLAAQTAGQVITDTGDTLDALTTALTKIEKRPIASLKNAEYSALVGQEITFDASESFIEDATITHYDWDVNGDGTFDQTTTEPRFNYSYPGQFSGTMQVRVVASNDTVASASAIVTVTTTIPDSPLPPAPTNLSATIAPITTGATNRTVTLRWSNPATLPSEGWVVSMDGTALGVISAERTSIEIRDVPFTEAVFSVAGISDSTVGNDVSVTAAAYTPPPPSPPKMNWLQKLIAAAIRLVVKIFHW